MASVVEGVVAEAVFVGVDKDYDAGDDACTPPGSPHDDRDAGSAAILRRRDSVGQDEESLPGSDSEGAAGAEDLLDEEDLPDRSPPSDDENELDHKISLKKASAAGAAVGPPASPLFEPMDEDRHLADSDTDMTTLESDGGGSTLISPNLDGLKRARTIKADIENNISVLKSKNKTNLLRRRVEDDPENQLIKTLRQEHRMDWGAIANYLNEERQKRGEPACFTTPAVYSRFVRNGPRIAAALGEIGFDPKDYMHLRNPKQYLAANTNLGSSIPQKRAREETDCEKGIKDNTRKRSKLADDCAELETTEKTELLMQAVATVERNFWIFVADELERMTTKLYDPRAIESRYHAI